MRAPTIDAITPRGIFSTEQIGEPQSLKPEGFLLREAMPITRIGKELIYHWRNRATVER